jgi:hypothetical protein
VPGGKAVTVKVENNAGVKDASLFIAAILGESLLRPCYRTPAVVWQTTSSKGCAPAMKWRHSTCGMHFTSTAACNSLFWCTNPVYSGQCAATQRQRWQSLLLCASAMIAAHAIAMRHCADGQQHFSLV